MDLSTIANVATALTVLTGAGFGLIEARRARKEREERAAFAALDAILSPEWMKSIVIVHAIPEGATAAEIGGTVPMAWRNLRQYVEFERDQSGSQKSWEWFQWLAEQLERHGTSRTNLGTGAYVAYRDWKP